MTEEAFLLRSLKEVVKVWGKGTGHATFNFSVKNGVGNLQLGFQLGLPHDPHEIQQHRPRRKGPSRRERDRKRAAEHQARVQAQFTASDKTTAAAVIAALSSSEELSDENYQTAGKSDNLRDEFCSDDIFDQNQETDPLDEIIVTLDCDSDLNNDNIETVIDYKLKILGINMVKIVEQNRGQGGILAPCLVKIEPIPLKMIENAGLPLRNWIKRA